MTVWMLRVVENGMYVKSYDPDFVPPPPLPNYPSGLLRLTSDPAQAMQFISQSAALECWLAESRTVPTRPDGFPNKPLSAITMLLEPVE